MNRVSGTIRPIPSELTWSLKEREGRAEKTKMILIALPQKRNNDYVMRIEVSANATVVIIL